MRSFAQLMGEDRRLAILRVLQVSPRYEANDELIAAVLGDFGHCAPRDQVRTDIEWLKEQGLVGVESVEQYRVATLTNRGLETVTGTVVTPGVRRPAPSLS